MNRKALFAAVLLLAAAAAAAFLKARRPAAAPAAAAPDCGTPAPAAAPEREDLLSKTPDDACGPGALLPPPR